MALAIIASCDRSQVYPEQKFLKGRLEADLGGLYSQGEMNDW
ncbi:hypothetical protein COO91_03073 [Nostoc flagelliforme CCNUN1]|uniref:Uncharacterized protein n=1 Tax=Nostoc flagelliforme CCNUN1 TaxID=2038116 RepID=A0A2K8SP01_9NOSO|nr:hypothetical protein [Nostoc flagelliforme]AUB37137.1 hypothetical protein COO91_03073 [Nostoc flagelliforme CCNUN1]